MTLVQHQALRAIQPYRETPIDQKTNFLSHPVFQLTGHSGSVNECHFSPDGNLLASCAGEIILWKVGSEIQSVGAIRSHNFPITSLAWFVDGTKFATSSADKTVALIDTGSGKVIRRFKDHREIVNCVQFTKDGQNLIVSGDDAGYVMVNDVRVRECVIKLKSNSPVTSISTNPYFVAVGGVCGNIFVDCLFENRLKMVYTLPGESIIFGTAFSPNLKYIASNESNGTLKIFSVQAQDEGSNRLLSVTQNGEPMQEVVPSRVAFSPDGRYVMCGSSDRLLRIFDIENVFEPLLKYELPGHKGAVTGVDFHPTHPIVVSGSTDGTIIVGELKESV
ncbi:WD40 repeat-like protein [Histomonas meleagridis]|uniref:WD40 repeat-like protein n=1 Tax=Histomonas meleagridis TaxID=135588 RepID=UPI00355A029F|nr:WD40 repeat-like protein [Histomonas meleagridis]KAH0806188.1 WD40 repeat-like protein [Histomonas meleagridis]